MAAKRKKISRFDGAAVVDAAFAEWKAAAQAHANDLGLPPELWTEADDYDLADTARPAFDRGDDPKAYVEEVFAEDLARMENDADEWAQSLMEGDG